MTRTDPLSDVFAALADGHRRQILAWLRERPMPVGALVDRLAPLSQPGVTRHLGVLERAGLIRRRADGRRRICELDRTGLAEAEAWMAEHRAFWETALGRLATLAEETGHDHRDPTPDPDPAPDATDD